MLRSKLSAILALILFSRFAGAEIVVMNSGESIQGEIVSNTNDVVQIRVTNAAGTISSVRPISRSNIKEIRREDTGELARLELQRAFQETRRYQLSSMSYPVGYYDQIITNVFQPFLTKYPDSGYSNTVSGLISQWTLERDKVADGNVKWGGQWHSGDEAQSMITQIRAAQQLINEGDIQLVNGRYEVALRKYRDAFANGTLPVDLLDQLLQKATATALRWKDALNAARQSSSSDQGSQTQALQDQRARYQTTIEKNQAQVDLIASARSRDVYISGKRFKHWVTPTGQDFGAVLPDPGPLNSGIASARAAIAKIDASISANNTRKANADTEVLKITAQLDYVDSQLNQFSKDLSKARIETQQRDLASANRKSAESRVAAASTPTEPQPTVTPNHTSRPRPVVERPETPSAIASATTAREGEAPIPVSRSWLDQYWQWLLGAFSLLMVGFIVRR